MKNTITITFLFLSYTIYSQVYDFATIPVKGKVSKLEIVEIVGDSLNPKEILLVSKSFDKNGVEITNTNYNLRTHFLAYNQKSYVSKNEITTYICRCATTDAFEKAFKIKDNAELKNEAKGSYAGGGNSDQPLTVVIKKIDSKGNIISEDTYSEKGYKTASVKKQYDNKNRLIKKLVYQANDVIYFSEESKYDENNNKTEEKTIFYDSPNPKEQIVNYKYDAKNQEIEFTRFQNNKLDRHYSYLTIEKDNVKEKIETDELKKSIIEREEIHYDNKGHEIKKLTFAADGVLKSKIENNYFENGNLKSRIFYNDGNTISRKLFFANDKNNNLIEIRVFILNSRHLKEGIKYETIEYKYIQKLVYY